MMQVESCLRSTTLPLRSVDSKENYHYIVVKVNAENEYEALKQVERDLRTQLSREPAHCIKCQKIVQVTIDGRCVGCYNARTFELFGVMPLKNLPIPV